MAADEEAGAPGPASSAQGSAAAESHRAADVPVTVTVARIAADGGANSWLELSPRDLEIATECGNAGEVWATVRRWEDLGELQRQLVAELPDEPVPPPPPAEGSPLRHAALFLQLALSQRAVSSSPALWSFLTNTAPFAARSPPLTAPAAAATAAGALRRVSRALSGAGAALASARGPQPPAGSGASPEWADCCTTVQKGRAGAEASLRVADARAAAAAAAAGAAEGLRRCAEGTRWAYAGIAHACRTIAPALGAEQPGPGPEPQHPAPPCPATPAVATRQPPVVVDTVRFSAAPGRAAEWQARRSVRAAPVVWRVVTPAPSHRVRAAPMLAAPVVAELERGRELWGATQRRDASGRLWLRVRNGWSLVRLADGGEPYLAPADDARGEGAGAAPPSSSTASAQRNPLREGQFIEVLGPSGKARGCVVTAVSSDSVRVHYDGFDSSFDEWLHNDSERILATLPADEGPESAVGAACAAAAQACSAVSCAHAAVALAPPVDAETAAALAEAARALCGRSVAALRRCAAEAEGERRAAAAGSQGAESALPRQEQLLAAAAAAARTADASAASRAERAALAAAARSAVHAQLRLHSAAAGHWQAALGALSELGPAGCACGDGPGERQQAPSPLPLPPPAPEPWEMAADGPPDTVPGARVVVDGVECVVDDFGDPVPAAGDAPASPAPASESPGSPQSSPSERSPAGRPRGELTAAWDEL